MITPAGSGLFWRYGAASSRCSSAQARPQPGRRYNAAPNEPPRREPHVRARRCATAVATLPLAVLVMISLAMFGNYYIYDSISPLADVLKAQLGFSDANIGLLNAIYSIPT